jgi:5-methylcytosine-specific restriction endonuclease McrBC GTP-binding regulatory subunit McrB
MTYAPTSPTMSREPTARFAGHVMSNSKEETGKRPGSWARPLEFLQAVKAASKDPASTFEIVIEEINRGSPAQIFGELLTLLEADKRMSTETLELCYPDEGGKRRPVHIPVNLHVVGTMNIADRSPALVHALRRRFGIIGGEHPLAPLVFV